MTMTLEMESYIHNPLAYISQLCAALGLEPGKNTEVRIVKAYSYDGFEKTTYHGAELNIDWKQLDPDLRRRLKRAVKLEVPDYALGGSYKEPPLHGKLEQIHQDGDQDHTTRLRIDFSVGGAYVCEEVGEQEQEPSEYELRQAKKLEEKSDAEILAEHNKRVAEMKAPRKKKSYRCRPA